MSFGDDLKRFLVLYEFDYGSLHFALNEAVSRTLDGGESLQTLTLNERVEFLRQGVLQRRREVLRKTLVEVPDLNQPLNELHADLVDQVFPAESRPKRSEQVRTCLYQGFETIGFIPTPEIEAENEEKLKKLDADDRQECVAALKRGSVEIALANWFAENIDKAATAIKSLDDTDFSRLVPSSFVTPFKELHLNLILGNFGTAVVLAAALLERTLQDLLPSRSGGLKDLIEDAKSAQLLTGHNIRFAQQINDIRNDLVHNRKLTQAAASRYKPYDFDDVSSDKAWELVVNMRTIISDLYAGGVEEKE